MYRTGYNPSPPDARDRRAAEVYAALGVSPPPPRTEWGKRLPAQLGMMANDRHGCCTCSTFGHMKQTWSAQHGPMVTISDAAILAAYNLVNGGRDAGADPRAVLDLARGKRNNSSIGGCRIARYARLDNSIAEIEQTVWQFGGAYLCFVGPSDLQEMDGWKDPAGHGPADPASAHAINVIDFDHAAQMFEVASWGRRIKMHFEYWSRYAAESWLLLSPDWWGGQALAPSGLSLPESMQVFQRLVK